ncbi:unnamed protein product [Rhodiola kirilowii]
MKAVAGLIGLVSIDVDMKSEKMVLVGSALDPVVVVTKLKKSGLVPKIESVGPAKEPEANKEEEATNPEAKNVDLMAEYVKAYYEGLYRGRSVEDDPNACCVIC